MTDEERKMTIDNSDDREFFAPYEVVPASLGGYVIRRWDPDQRARTVALVDNLAQWRRFKLALNDGAGEVAAVHAIDDWHSPGLIS